MSIPLPTSRLSAHHILLLTLGAAYPAAHAASPIETAAEQILPAVEVTSARENARLNLDTPAETGSRLGLTPRETPASVTIIDRTVIEARGADDTQEILKAIPGVTAHNAPGSIGVSYRGFNSGSLSQLYNGIDVKYTIASRPVDSWIVDRVEAIGGPSSFLNGAGAIGGSINTITKLAQRQDISEGRIRLGTDNTKEASIGLNRRIAGDDDGNPAHYARIDLNHRKAGSWIDGTHTDSTQLAASLLSVTGRGLTHTLAYEYQTEKVDRPYWGTPLLKPTVGTLQIDEGTRFKNYNSADGIYEQRVQWLRSMTDLQVNDALHFTNTFYVYDALRDYRNVESYAFNVGNTAVVRSGALLQRHDQRLVGNRLDGTYKGQLGGKRSDWSFGLDISLNKQTRFPSTLPSSTVISTVNPYAFTTGNFFDETGIPPSYNPDRTNKITTVAAYLENRTALQPTLNLVTALRAERIDLDLLNHRAVTAANPASYQRNYTPVTGRIGLVWDITPNAMAYVQYATAADPPAGSLSTATFANAIANTELTTGKQVEIGSKMDFWNGRGNAAIAVYSIDRRNVAVTTNNITQLIGEQRSTGIEVSAGLAVTPLWSVQGNVTYVDAHYKSFFTSTGLSLAGNTPSNTPSTVANVWTNYAFTPNVTGTMGVRHVGKIYANNTNTATWSAYTLLDLGLSYQISPKMSLVARVKNVTDKTYALNVSSDINNVPQSAYLGAPRTADVTLRIAF